MTSLKTILGSEVVSRADAEKIGKLEGAVIDVPSKRVIAWQVGKGRKATFVDHAHLVGIGDAATIIDEAPSLRAAAGELELATEKGHRSLIGAYVLSEAGDSLGHIADADIETASGSINTITTDSVQIPAGLLQGFGSFAVVVGLPPAG